MSRARLGALAVLLVVAGSLAACASSCDCGPPLARGADPSVGSAAIVLRLPPMSFEQAMAIPELRALARAGGAALLSNGTDAPTLDAIPGADVVTLPQPLADLGAEIRTRIERLRAAEVLVIAMSVGQTPVMTAEKDELHPVIVARGSPQTLLDRGGPERSLTSDSTRRPGVVVASDVLATVAAFRGRTAPTIGQPVRVDGAAPPFALHARYLAQRRLSVPIGTAAAMYVVIAGVFAVACVALRERIDARLARAMGWASLAVPALGVALLAVGHLTTLTYADVIPFVLLVTVLGTFAFSPLERRDLTLVPAGIGVAVLAYFAVEAALGWTAMLTPLLGGSELDGGRFYGLPNVAIGLLIGASVWVAQRLSTGWGFVLICAVALFAGLPLVGTNLGGGVSLFATAGLWLAVRERGRLGVVKGLAVAAVVTIAGTAVILVAHAVSPVATHVTEFERSAGGASDVVAKIRDRLAVGWHLMARSPGSIVPVAGLPVTLYVLWRAPGAIGETFRRWPAWRDAILVALLGGVVAYLANDSGPAAAGLAFGLALGGMLGVALLAMPRPAAGEMMEP